MDGQQQHLPDEKQVPPNATPQHIVELLSNSSTYREPPASIRVVETHISWIFLTKRHAYKLKKPVRFEFLDFSMPELRRRACLDEVRLNGRLAPDVYLDVLPVTCDPSGNLALAGAGQPVDWVVQMRRLPANKALDKLLRRGVLTPDQSHTLAEHLAGFYARLPPAPQSPIDYRQSLERHIRANGDVLLPMLTGRAAVAARRAISSQLRFLHLQADMFAARVASGHIVEGHGDLRPEHIYLEHQPAIIDCIEFSADLRTVDAADDLAFLAMECELLGHNDLGDQVFQTYQHACADHVPRELLAFYKSYRACVRAKVVVLRAQQAADAATRRSPHLVRKYVDAADHYASALGPACLLIVAGLMGTGKSTLADALANSFAIDLLATDRIRRSTFGASAEPLAYDQGIYDSQVRRRIYDELFRRAGGLLAQGESVILDGTFLRQRLRQDAVQLARRHGAVPLCVWCQCPRETALSRITERTRIGRSHSEARADLYDQQAGEAEPPRPDEPALIVDTTHDLPHQQQAVFTELRRRLFSVARPPP